MDISILTNDQKETCMPKSPMLIQVEQKASYLSLETVKGTLSFSDQTERRRLTFNA